MTKDQMVAALFNSYCDYESGSALELFYHIIMHGNKVLIHMTEEELYHDMEELNEFLEENDIDTFDLGPPPWSKKRLVTVM